MAKKKTGKKAAPQTNQMLSRLQKNMQKLQRDAEGVLKRTRKQASELMSRDQKRALDRLVNQAQQLRKDFEKRAQRASKEVESRAERFLSTIEKETNKRLEPLLRRLDLPSRHEIHGLSRRIDQLEKRMRERPAPRHRPAPVEPAPAAPMASGGSSEPTI